MAKTKARVIPVLVGSDQKLARFNKQPNSRSIKLNPLDRYGPDQDAQ